MTLFEIARFVHFLGLVAIFGGFVLYTRAGSRLRAAGTPAQADAALSLLELTRSMFPGGAVMLLLSGGYMAASRWRSAQPWFTVAAIALVALWVLAAVVGGRHLRAVRAALDADAPALSPEFSRLVVDPLPWSVMAGLNGVAMAILWSMVAKPGWTVSVTLVLAAAAVGALAGRAAARSRRGAPSTPSGRGVGAGARP